MLSLNKFCQIQHHLSEMTGTIIEPSREMVYERFFQRDKFVNKERLNRLPSEFATNQQLLKHPNIVNFSLCTSTEGGYVLQRKYINGENFNYFVSLTNLSTKDAMETCRIIAKVVKFIHKQGLTIKTLNPTNIIIDSNGEVKIVDACVECIFYDKYHDRNEPADLLFLGPEGLQDVQTFEHTQARDIWCLGLIVYLAFTGTFPWPVNNKMKILSYMKDVDVKFPDGLNKDLCRLITMMLDGVAARRPTAKFVCHELKMLERSGKCSRVDGGAVKSVQDLPVYNKIPVAITQSCHLPPRDMSIRERRKTGQ